MVSSKKEKSNLEKNLQCEHSHCKNKKLFKREVDLRDDVTEHVRLGGHFKRRAVLNLTSEYKRHQVTNDSQKSARERS